MSNKDIGFELHSLNNLIRRHYEFSSHKREIDKITGNNGWIIGFLADNASRDIYQKDIEGQFAITRSTVSKVLSLMEQKGLVKRQAVPGDARLKKIVLTEKAWEIRAVMMEDIMRMESTLTKGFKEEELNTLSLYLRRMKDNIHDNIKKQGDRK